ncbi:MAG: carboxypeptidase-like regulatory domain-containing protein [Pirellula sp.]
MKQLTLESLMQFSCSQIFAGSSLRSRTLAPCMMMASLFFLLSGCGSDLSTVKGKVTLDGTPVENAFVEFVPKGKGTPSYGRTDKDGNYYLAYSLEKNGAAPGEYAVRISTADVGDVGRASIPERVPDRYNRKTELSAEVKANQSSVFNFDLKTDGAKITQPKQTAN